LEKIGKNVYAPYLIVCMVVRIFHTSCIHYDLCRSALLFGSFVE
jgi:hypothetical protein